MKWGAALLLMVLPVSAQESIVEYSRGWSPDELAAIHRFYEPVGPFSRSSHWHHYDCCQTMRCFPARPGSVRWTPDGVAITHPDGDIHLYAEDDPIWKPKQLAGLEDPRNHVCFEIVDGEWTVLCAYGAGVHG